MKRETFEELIDALNEVQNEAMSKEEKYEGLAEDKNKLFYFLGKDVGIARAKDIIRDLVEVQDE